MKKIIGFIKDNKIIFVTLLIQLYGLFLRLNLPYQIPIHENNHGISFINDVTKNIYGFNYLLDGIKGNISGLDYGYIPKIIYSNIIINFNLNYKIIFILNILFDLLTGIFIGLFLRKLFNNNFIYYIAIISYIVTPIFIRTSSTESLFVLGNFFISVSFFLFIYFLNKKNVWYILFSSIFFFFSIYTQNLYLLYIPFYFIIVLFFYFFYNINLKTFLKKNKFILLIVLSIITILIILIQSRIDAFINQSVEHNISIATMSLLTVYEFLTYIFPYAYVIFIFLLFPLLLINYFRSLKYVIISTGYFTFIFVYCYFLFSGYLSKGWPFLFLERIFYPFLLILFILGVLGAYYLINIIKKSIYKKIIIIVSFLFLLLLPFLNAEFIKRLYNQQEEFIFLVNNIDLIKDNSNIMVLGSPNHSIISIFPEFIFDDSKKITLYSISSYDNLYKKYYNNLNKLKGKENYFFLGVDCYRFDIINEDNNLPIRKECSDFIKKNKLVLLNAKNIYNNPYLIGKTSNIKELKIGIYKLK